MKLKVTIGIFIVVFLGLVLLLYANGKSSNDCAYSQMASSDKNPVIDEVLIGRNEYCVEKESETNNEPFVSDSTFAICRPASLPDISEQIVKKKTYITSYNTETRQPNWVAWHLTAEHTDGPCGRIGNFHEEEDVPTPRATLDDYRGSGWSRGHMCPAGDNKWDERAMYESFSLVNVCPQNANLNSGLWNSIEIDCRRWANRFGDVYIVCGPVFYNKEHVVIGYNEVYVPEAFFKVVLCLNDKPKGMGLVVKNTDGNKKRDLYYNSIDQVERITGMDFFPALPDDIEKQVEAEVNLKEWR